MLTLVRSFGLKEITPLINATLSGSEIVFNCKRFSSQEIFGNPRNNIEELFDGSKNIVKCALVDSKGSICGVAFVERSNWDSEILGVGVGKLKLAVFNRDVDLEGRALLFQDIKEQAFANGLVLIFSKVPLNDFLTIHALETKGAILAAILLTLIGDSSLIPTTQTGSDIEVEFATPSDENTISTIAAQTFTFDHFHSDSRLPKNKCDELHSMWVSNSLKGLADAVLVAKKNEEILGFLTCKIESDYMKSCQKGIIDLVGVKNSHKGFGIGSLLVSKALEWFSNKTDLVLVGTQAANIPAIRLYQRMGFKQINSEATMHFWTS